MADYLSDYLSGSAELLEFYAHPPEALFENPLEPAPWDPALAEALEQYQTALGTGGTFSGTEPVVITGQQPAIFAGPLYTIYKAVTVLRLTRKVSERTGVDCVPMFWVGTEDHDFEEARAAHFLTKNHDSLTLRYTPTHNVDGFPMHGVPLDASLHALVDEAAEKTPGSEFREAIAAFLHETLEHSASLGEWAARLLARLFRDTPLVFFVPHMPAAREAARPILEREIRHPLESTALLNECGLQLERLGYPPQVTKGETECNFFLQMGDRRRKVLFEKRRFRIPEEELSCTIEEMLRLLEASPERFSPNVALRCIVQQHLFPVAAYVAGPGELAYWAQLKPLFEWFGTSMPVVYPRARCALTTLKLNKLRTKLGLELDALAGPREELVDRALRFTAKNPAYAFATQQRQHIETELAKLAEGLGKHNKTAAGMAAGLSTEVASKLDRLENTILQGDEAKREAARKQVERLCNSLAPSRKPQERHYTIFSFLFEHGWDLIPRLIDGIDVESFDMQEIEL